MVLMDAVDGAETYVQRFVGLCTTLSTSMSDLDNMLKGPGAGEKLQALHGELIGVSQVVLSPGSHGMCICSIPLLQILVYLTTRGRTPKTIVVLGIFFDALAEIHRKTLGFYVYAQHGP
jgi:hypothetical protein